MIEVTEFTDPGCPWAWASEPQLRRLRSGLDEVAWRRVQGVKVPDPVPGERPADPAGMLEGWRAIGTISGAPIPSWLGWSYRSTVPMALVAKAAEHQGGVIADAVLRRLRETTFVLGRPADTLDRAVAAAGTVAGVDVARLASDVTSDEVARALEDDRAETRRPRPEVVGLTEPQPHPGAAVVDGESLRYGFPTLLVSGPKGTQVVPGWRSFEQYLEVFEAVDPGASQRLKDPVSPEEALEEFGTLTAPELVLLTGGEEPEKAVRLPTGNGEWFVHPDEVDVFSVLG